MAKSEEKSLGKNVSFSEDQRSMLLQIVQVAYKSGGLQSEAAHDLVKSIRMAVDWSAEELATLKARAEKKAVAGKAGALKK